MKIHYIVNRVCGITACGLPVLFVSLPVTTWRESVTCKSCIRCFDSYTERYNVAIKQYENTDNEDLLVKVIDDALGLWNNNYSKPELVSSLHALLERLADHGFIRKLDRVEIDWFRADRGPYYDPTRWLE